VKVLLYGASGRIGRRITDELVDRGHSVTGVSRSGDAGGFDHSGCEAVSGDATDAADVARPIDGQDAGAPAPGTSPDEDADVPSETAGS
jgi:putative NADH-flavin reductase